MAIKREKKESILQNLQQVSKDSASIVFVKFSAVGVNESNTLRRAADLEDTNFCVVKKTLLKKALHPKTYPELEGEIAICYGSDSLAPARVMGQQSKILQKRMEIVGGFFEGEYMDAVAMQEIATIPDLQTLRARFLGILQSPVRMLTVVVNEYAKKLG